MDCNTGKTPLLTTGGAFLHSIVLAVQGSSELGREEKKMLNEKQRSLIVLLFICSAFLSSILTSRYGEVDEFWVVYNLPAYLLVLLSPSWTVVIAIVMAMLFLKYTSILFINPELADTAFEISKLIIGSAINISLFLTVSYFIISLEKRFKKAKKEEEAKTQKYKEKCKELNSMPTENKEDTL